MFDTELDRFIAELGRGIPEAFAFELTLPSVCDHTQAIRARASECYLDNSKNTYLSRTAHTEDAGVLCHDASYLML